MSFFYKKCSIHIDVPVQAAWDFFIEPENINLYHPDPVEQWDFDPKPVKLGYKWKNAEIAAGARWVFHNEVTTFQPLKNMTYSYTNDINGYHATLFEEERGGTLMTEIVEYDVPPHMMAKIDADALKVVASEEADEILETIKAYLEKEHQSAR